MREASFLSRIVSRQAEAISPSISSAECPPLNTPCLPPPGASITAQQLPSPLPAAHHCSSSPNYLSNLPQSAPPNPRVVCGEGPPAQQPITGQETLNDEVWRDGSITFCSVGGNMWTESQPVNRTSISMTTIWLTQETFIEKWTKRLYVI